MPARWPARLLPLFLRHLPACLAACYALPPAVVYRSCALLLPQMKDGCWAKEQLVDRVCALFRTKVIKPCT